MLRVHVKDLGLPDMAKKKRATHPDGSICEEGIRNVPRGWKPCCDALKYRTTACIYDVRIQWFTRSKCWGIRLTDGTNSFISIDYCPFCGTGLEPPSAGQGRRLM